MTNNFANSSYTIVAGAAVSGTLAQASRIQVACGRVWLTIAGQEHDFWLHAGETMLIPAGRLIVIEADKQASAIDIVAVTAPVSATISARTPVSQPQNMMAATWQKLSNKLSQAFA